MAFALSDSAPTPLKEYYRILAAGPGAYGDGQALRRLLSDHLDFTGSLAGHRPDSPDGFVRGVAGFLGSVGELTLVQDVHDARGSAVLYDAAMPGGTVRFAEFFTLAGGLITSVNLHYDGADYLAKGGR